LDEANNSRIQEHAMNITQIDRNCIAAQTQSGIFPFRLDICLYNIDGILIDAGSSMIMRQLISFFEKYPVQCAALTHVHEDHTGSAALIREKLGKPVYLHQNSIEEASVKSSIPLYRRLVWGNHEGFSADPMPEYLETGNYRLDVIDAPGHHRDHVVFHEKNKGWLFTGDLYVSRTQAVAFKDENISDAIDSLTRILQLDFDTVFCGHSGVQKNGKEKIRAKLDNYLRLREEVNALREKGLGPEDIDKQLFPKKNLWTYVSRGEWSTLNMVRTV